MSSSNRLPNEYQCRHIFPDGARCGSPRMRNQDRCYYHHESRGPVRDPYQRNARRGTFAPLPPSSFGTIQETLDQVLVRIASNDIDLRRAGLLLYCLQIASTNLRHAKKSQPETSLPVEQWKQENTEDDIIGTPGAEADGAEAEFSAEPLPVKAHSEAPVLSLPEARTPGIPTPPGSVAAAGSPATPSSATAATSESPQPAHHPR